MGQRNVRDRLPPYVQRPEDERKTLGDEEEREGLNRFIKKDWKSIDVV